MLSQYTQSIVIFIVSLVVLLTLFTTVIYTLYNKSKRKQQAYTNELRQLQFSNENKVLQAQVDMQEYIFQTISRDIHDNIGQKLSFIKLVLNSQSSLGRKLTAADTMDSLALVSGVIEDLSDLTNSKSSKEVIRNGLVKTIKSQLLQLEKAHLYEISFSTTGQVFFLEGPKELSLFRIVQEGLQNIIKHAHASSIDIRVHYEPGSLKLLIADNGIGFTKERFAPGIGHGNIRKRVDELQGTCIIESSAGGTRLTVEVPTKINPYA